MFNDAYFLKFGNNFLGAGVVACSTLRVFLYAYFACASESCAECLGRLYRRPISRGHFDRSALYRYDSRKAESFSCHKYTQKVSQY